MTLKDVREFSRLVTSWCLDQDDLEGFYVGIGGTPYTRVLRVVLYWPNGWKASRDYVVEDIRILETDRGWLNDTLDFLARAARQRAARIADPNRLPG